MGEIKNEISKRMKPPRLAEWILRLTTKSVEKFSILGDYEEEFIEIIDAAGLKKARLWYLRQTLNSVIPFLINNLYLKIAMFKNYMKIALRNIRKNKTFSLLNILGLAVGIASSILILLYIQYELSFDKYHENANRIYRIVKELRPGSHGDDTEITFTPAPLKAALLEEFPEVVSAARISREREKLLSYENRRFIESYVSYADPEIFDIFSLPLIKGDPETALSFPNSIILSERMAEKYFGSENPIGKVMTYNNSIDLQVTGILKDLSDNSHFFMDIVIPFESSLTNERLRTSWFSNPGITYILLSDDGDPQDLENKFPELFKRHYKTANGAGNSEYTRHFLQPLTKIHLYSDMAGELRENNSVDNLLVVSSIGFLILMIACINYMNLATARAERRSKEIGIRKVVGAHKRQLVRQFFCESAIFTFLALGISMVTILFVLPYFNLFIERELSLNLINNFRFIFWLLGFTGAVILIAGSYPALFVSSYKPVSVLKGEIIVNQKGISLRNVLVIAQFSISVIFIISTLIIKDQLSFIRNTDVGYSKDRIVVVDLRDNEARKNIETIVTELKRNPDILAASGSSFLPNRGAYIITGERYSSPGFDIYLGFADFDFVDLYDIKILEGRNFSRDFASDKERAFLFNESLVKALGWETPIGREFNHRLNGKVVGVMRDFNFESLHKDIEPLYINFGWKEAYRYLSVKIQGNNIPETLSFIEGTMKTFSPKYPFSYSFFDEVYDRTYRSEQRMESMFRIFATIAVGVACFGLFGLASFTAEKRTKEIGVRKVLGANVSDIVLLLTKEFTKCVMIANLIAWPIGYYIMNKWLQNFAYRINIEVWIFILSAALSFIVALFTVSYQAIKAAVANPVDALKYE